MQQDTTKTSPTVTVLMSAYGVDAFLHQAVESVLCQDYEDFEFLIIDDASPQDIATELKCYGDLRMKIVRNEYNLGLTRSLNKGLQMACGRYIARMDADDISLPQRLKIQVNYMEKHPEIGLLGGQADCIDGDGNIVFQERHPTDELLLRWLLLFINPFWHSSIMLRASVLKLIGGYNNCVRYAQDYDLWHRLAPHTRFAQLCEPVILYRIQGKSITSSCGREQEAIALNIIRNALQILKCNDMVDDDIRGVREILINLPACHANEKSIKIMCSSIGMFAKFHKLTFDHELAIKNYAKKKMHVFLRNNQISLDKSKDSGI
ncbi:hypothetical protein DSCOOX_15060 [Desulfosarcina ovata subsp. ovata]|uniref:Glycosyltransferase 2-like domain-containing protein n=2 Tax=Desulfosarcina ovata TaxID=83564 RepID=A0A5K8A799_9BACT|nr:hypothetical protein DSCOOX_15060 [Desulfosarcina ovata subsp. ovata]